MKEVNRDLPQWLHVRERVKRPNSLPHFLQPFRLGSSTIGAVPLRSGRPRIAGSIRSCTRVQTGEAQRPFSSGLRLEGLLFVDPLGGECRMYQKRYVNTNY